jgi:hypothetical protein
MSVRRSNIQCVAMSLGLVASLAACGSEVGNSGSGGSGGTSSSGVGGQGTGGAGAGGENTGGGGSMAGCTPAQGEQGARVDVLFDVDNSRSMADKQEILSLVIGDLVGSLTNPPCVDANGAPAAEQPPGGQCACPDGTSRVFTPVTDMHIGVISSSIGGHGSDACPNTESNTCGGPANTSNNDKGHLLSRKDPCSNQSAPTYENKGFLAWDPTAQQTPPGEASQAAYAQTFKDLVLGAGQIGCGYESQLESWYRFLVDPEPYASISVVDNKATPMGIDTVLLAQRAEFLRPDSLLAVFMLTDENDCSTKEFGQFFFANQLKNGNGTQFHLPRPRAECATNPNDPCCRSCGQAPGACPVDPTCTDANDNIKPLTSLEDATNLRCFDQKRRFGIDFLHPIERYALALTGAMVPNRAGDLVPNPIFSDLNPMDDISTIRGPGQVLLTGIVGVPWQDIARDPTDLTKGLKNAQELAAAGANGQTGWDVILGDPAMFVAPSDPHMKESIDPRAGVNPITGDAIAPPSAPNGTNPINGHEFSTPTQDDLQYACIMKLQSPRDCADPSIVSCDCRDPMNDNPLCELDPASNKRTRQVSAKAYPGIRELAVLKALDGRGITASICAAQTTTPAGGDFAYRPAINAFIERAKPLLSPAP